MARPRPAAVRNRDETCARRSFHVVADAAGVPGMSNGHDPDAGHFRGCRCLVDRGPPRDGAEAAIPLEPDASSRRTLARRESRGIDLAGRDLVEVLRDPEQPVRRNAAAIAVDEVTRDDLTHHLRPAGGAEQRGREGLGRIAVEEHVAGSRLLQRQRR